MQSKAKTVDEYLAGLPDDRREALQALRKVIRKNLGKGYQEGMQYGMPGWFVPHSVYPPGYHCNPTEPLPFVGMASQKNHMSLYLMCVYGHSDGSALAEFQKAWAKTGKKLDMGKACVRFKKLDDLALDVIGETIKSIPVRKYIEHYEAAILTSNKAAAARRAKAKSGTKAMQKKDAAKKKPGGRKSAAAKPGRKRVSGKK